MLTGPIKTSANNIGDRALEKLNSCAEIKMNLNVPTENVFYPKRSG